MEDGGIFSKADGRGEQDERRVSCYDDDIVGYLGYYFCWVKFYMTYPTLYTTLPYMLSLPSIRGRWMSSKPVCKITDLWQREI